LSTPPRESSTPFGDPSAASASSQGAGAREPSDEELRAAYEAELKRITIDDVVLQTVVSLINLGGRRLGLTPDSRDERDLEQVRDAIDSVRALMPVLERRGLPELAQIRDALSRLQLAYAREQAAAPAPGSGQGQTSGAADTSEPEPGPPKGGAPPGGKPGGAAPGGKPGGPKPADETGHEPGPAESSGRLWVPGR
jgi:hypothetical protein